MTAFHMLMDMEMSEEGQEETVRIAQEITATLSQLNEIEEIVVPAEIIENAVE